jgi:hypothetical protein
MYSCAKVIAVEEGHAQALAQQRPHGRLSAAGDAHNNQGRQVRDHCGSFRKCPVHPAKLRRTLPDWAELRAMSKASRASVTG